MKILFDHCCRLCQNFATGVTEYQGELIDREPILAESDNFFLVPDLSPVSRYHLLIVSKHHYTSMSMLSDELLEELELLCNWACNKIKESIGGNYAIFEHGSGSESSRSFNSVNHLHLHIVQFEDKLSKFIDGKVLCKKKSISKLSDVKSHTGKEYIFIADYDGAAYVLLFEHSEVRSQLLRKIIFEHKRSNLDLLNAVSHDWKKGIDLSDYYRSADILKKIFL